MKAFHDARRYAPGFVVSCGVLPEVSESASERLHTIVREVAERHLDGRRHMVSLQKRLRQELDSAEATDRIGRNLTELIGSEATAAYLFGLAVGLAIQALPERLNRHPR
ncbi:MAG TPA: hypothetical protein VIK60_12790 [Vicinamibacterales bacterium]